YADLRRPCRSTREQEIGDVRTGNEKDEAGHDQQQPGNRQQFATFRWPHSGQCTRHYRRTILIGVWVFRLEGCGDSAYHRLRLLNRNVRMTSSDCAQPQCAALVEPRGLGRVDEWNHGDRDPDICRLPEFRTDEASWRDADDGDLPAVDHDRAIWNVSAESLLRQAVADQSDRRCAGFIVSQLQCSSLDRGDSEGCK